jgi:hypothetical protein
MRKVLIAIAAVATLIIMIPLDASARHGGGGGGRGGGWHGGGGFRGASIGRSFGRASFGHGGMRGFRTSGFRQSHTARWRGGRFAHRGRFIAAAPLLYAPYSYYFSDYGYGYGYDYAYYDGCYELQPLLTPRGLIWQRTWVCY